MTILSEQLDAIFLEIKANFGQHRQIHVVPIAGSPPEQYRITYHLQGLCKKNGGEIQTCTDHSITLNLPFGFPHFPPNCKPETPVFHPDFDQAAICISEFWESNQSLTALIIQIGRMLCGEIYSTTNAFNEEAAIWYQENQKKLPLDTVEPTASGLKTPSPPATHATSPAMPLTLDIVDDILFPDNEIKSLNEVDDHSQGDIAFADLATKKTPDTSLTLEPSSAPSQDSISSSGLSSELQHKLNEARKKHQEGEAFEHQGQPARALERYQTVKNLAPDFPEIDQDISRAQYSVEMLDGWATEDLHPKDDKKRATPKSPEKKEPPAKSNTIPLHQDSGKTSWRPMIIVGIGSGVLFLILISAYLYFNALLQRSQTMFEECKQLMETGRFTQAEEKCKEAFNQTSVVHFIKQQEKNLLVEAIKQLQNSKELQEGLALSKGKDSDTMPKWQESLKSASKYLADAQWTEALTGYTHTLQLVSGIPTFDRAILDQIHNNMAIAKFNIALQAGEQALAADESESAKNHFHKAMDIARVNPQIPPENITRIKALIGQVELNTLIATGEEYFGKGDWNNALTAFEQAQEKERTLSPSDIPSRSSSIQENIVRTKIFNSLEQGKKAFADAQWDQAINYYETALQLLEENSEILRRDNPLQSQQKISRLMLHAATIRDKQSAASHLKNKEFSEGINKLQAVIETINKSSFANEQEFQTIIKETRVSVNQAQDDLLITEHTTYLTTNFQKLFTENNPALSADNLLNPRVSFLKKIGDKSLYKIQCFEQGHGRPVLLQASYIYDPATKKWRFYGSETSVNEQEAEITGQKILNSAYQAQERRVIAAQVSYLTNNFQALFIQDNPDLLPDTLSKPEAIFQKKIGEKFLFLLQCLQRKPDGSSVSLKISYLYNPVSNQWDPYDKKQND
jgi:hypothetical protein